MKAVIVFAPTSGPTMFREITQIARTVLTGEADDLKDRTLTDKQARQFGSGAKVRVPFQLGESEGTWRDGCLLRHDAEVGVVFYVRGRGEHKESVGVWMCGWVDDATEERTE